MTTTLDPATTDTAPETAPDAAPDTATDAPVPVVHPTGPMPYLDHVPPGSILMQDNSRTVGDITQTRPKLHYLIGKFGVRDPLFVSPNAAGQLWLREGYHRNTSATVHGLPTVPVIVVDPADDRPETVLLEQLNLNNTQQEYTAAELADAYERLALFDLDDDTIAAELGTPVDQIRAGRRIAQSHRTKTLAEANPQLDMLTLAALAEFEDDEDAHTSLVQALEDEPERFEEYLATERQARLVAQRTAAAQQQLREQGYALVDRPLPATTRELSLLCVSAADRTPLTAQTHTDCPGRGAYLHTDYQGEVRAVPVCVDYAEHGHHSAAQAAADDAIAGLRAAGVRVIAPDYPREQTRPLHQLYPGEHDTTRLNEDTHRDCPGHAATVTPNRPDSPTVTWVCENFADHGHESWTIHQPASTGQPAPSKSFQTAERNRVRDNNRHWHVAQEKRRTWLLAFFHDWDKRVEPGKETTTAAARRKKKTTDKPLYLPTRAIQRATTTLVLGRGPLATALTANSTYACTLLGLKPPRANQPHPIVARLKRASTAQTIMIQLALVLGGLESRYDIKQTRDTWRSPTDEDRVYFTLLNDLDYQPFTVERLVLDPTADAGDWSHLRSAADSTDAAEVDHTNSSDTDGQNDTADDPAADDDPDDGTDSENGWAHEELDEPADDDWDDEAIGQAA